MPSLPTFLPPANVSWRRHSKCLPSHTAPHLSACATIAAATTPPAKDSSIPPSSVTTTGTLPPSLRGTTILHNIPSLPPHLTSAHLAHPLDGDGYLLATSYQPSGLVWLRARFARTKAFMAEANAGRRLYRGLHGTPGATGWDAPLKPKPAAAAGTFLWGRGKKRRAFAFGPRALPIAMDAATLVARGPTALGSVLTDAPELTMERGTELAAAPVRRGESLFVLSIGRATSGRLTGAFIVEIDRDYNVVSRLPRVQLPPRFVIVDFVVGEKFCVVLLHRMEDESGPGVIGTLLGRKQETRLSPAVDVDFGSVLLVIPRDGSSSASCQLPGALITQLTRIGEATDGELQLSALALTTRDGSTPRTPVVRMSTLADARSGRLWTVGSEADYGRVKAKRVILDVSRGSEGMSESLDKQISEGEGAVGDVSLLCVAKQYSADARSLHSAVYTMFDHANSKAGLAVIKTSEPNAGTSSTWTAEDKGCVISGPSLCEDGRHVSVLVTREDSVKHCASVMIFVVDSVSQGPVHVVDLDVNRFGVIGSSVGGVWNSEAVDWSEEGSKPVKSAYEIFDSRRWNDIESGFSSLGLGQ